MAGPRIPEWQNVQGIQEGGMSAAYDKAGALFTTAIQAGQNILDDKVKRESAEAMEGILGSDNREELGEAQEAARSNVWADQTRVTEAGLGQKEKFDTKDIVDEERVYTRDRHTTQDTLAQQKADDTAAYQKESNRIAAERNKEDAKIRWAELDARNAERKAAAARVEKNSATAMKLQNELGAAEAARSVGQLIRTSGVGMPTVGSGTVDSWIVGTLNGIRGETGNTKPDASELASGVYNTIQNAKSADLDKFVNNLTKAKKGVPLDRFELAEATSYIDKMYEDLIPSAIEQSKAYSIQGSQAVLQNQIKFVSQFEGKDARQATDTFRFLEGVLTPPETERLMGTVGEASTPETVAQASSAVVLAVGSSLEQRVSGKNPEAAKAVREATTAQVAGGNVNTMKKAAEASAKVTNAYASAVLKTEIAAAQTQFAKNNPSVSMNTQFAKEAMSKISLSLREEIAADLGKDIKDLDFSDSSIAQAQIANAKRAQLINDNLYGGQRSGMGADIFNSLFENGSAGGTVPRGLEHNAGRTTVVESRAEERARERYEEASVAMKAAMDSVSDPSTNTAGKSPKEFFTKKQLEDMDRAQRIQLRNLELAAELYRLEEGRKAKSKRIQDKKNKK